MLKDILTLMLAIILSFATGGSVQDEEPNDSVFQTETIHSFDGRRAWRGSRAGMSCARWRRIRCRPCLQQPDHPHMAVPAALSARVRAAASARRNASAALDTALPARPSSARSRKADPD